MICQMQRGDHVGRMNVYPGFLSVAIATLGLAVSLSAAPLRVLYFTKSSGYEHSVIKQVDGAPSFSENLITKWAPKHDIEFTFSKDGSKFSTEYLAQFDMIMFYTSGHLLSVGTDCHPTLTLALMQALLDAVAWGKGFVGMAICSDKLHTYEGGLGMNQSRVQRFTYNGEPSDLFIR